MPTAQLNDCTGAQTHEFTSLYESDVIPTQSV